MKNKTPAEKRRKIIKDYADSHPEESGEEIGMVFGITRQRFSQIVGKRPRRRE